MTDAINLCDARTAKLYILVTKPYYKPDNLPQNAGAAVSGWSRNSMEYEIYLRQFGYVVLIIGTMLEGETFLFLAGIAAHQGLLSLEWVLAMAYLGTVAGDQAPFFLGRFKGRQILKKRPQWRARCEKVFEWLIRHRLKVLLFYRFMYGFRGVTPFVFGLTSFPAKQFIAINLIIGLVWTLTFGMAGYYLGKYLEGSGLEYKSIQLMIGLLIALAFTVYLGIKLRRNGRG